MYRAPVKDLRFVLDELLGTEQLRACPEFSEYSSETNDAVLGEAARFAEMVLEPLCKSGDREGAHWTPDGVTMPEGFKEAYQQFCDNGWPALRSKAEFGGQNVPSVLGTAVEYDIPAVWVVWNNHAYASIRGLQRGYLGGRELATDFKHPQTGAPYNPGFAAMARSAGVAGVTIDRPADLADAVRAGIATGKPYLIDAMIGADQNPGGAGVWELPGHGVSAPVIGGRYQPS